MLAIPHVSLTDHSCKRAMHALCPQTKLVLTKTGAMVPDLVDGKISSVPETQIVAILQCGCGCHEGNHASRANDSTVDNLRDA